MSAVTSPITAPVTTEEKVEHHYLNHSSGFLSWALTLDHKRIGMMYLAGILFAFFLGGVFALAIRFHLWNPNQDPDSALFTNQTYNRIFYVARRHHGVPIYHPEYPSSPW